MTLKKLMTENKPFIWKSLFHLVSLSFSTLFFIHWLLSYHFCNKAQNKVESSSFSSTMVSESTRPQYTQQTNESKLQQDPTLPLSFVHCGTGMASLSCVLAQIWILAHHNRHTLFCRMNTFRRVCFIRQYQPPLGHLLNWWSLFRSKILFLVTWY
jgi:hypothetical protein